jgi:predicted nucleotidyltransferase
MPIKNKKIKRKMIKKCKVQTARCKQAAFRVTLLRLQCLLVILDLRLNRQVQLLLKQTFSNSSEVLKSLEMIKKLQQIQS